MENMELQLARQLGPNLSLEGRLGKGAFGEVFAAKHKAYSKLLAIKVEWKVPDEPEEASTLLREAKVLRALRDVEGIPSVKEYKSGDSLRYIVMDRLGPNAVTLLKHSGGKFSLKTVLMLFDQLIARLEAVHNRGFIHRDIKPENFVIGDEAAQNRVYLIDFGISKAFRSKEGRLQSQGMHLSRKARCNLIGTARFASIAAHCKVEQGRKDDLESLGYSVVYLLKGWLPWMDLESVKLDKRLEKIQEMKQTMSPEELCQGLPEEFCLYFKYVKKLNFSESPSYSHLRKLVARVLAANTIVVDYCFDWIVKEVGKQVLPQPFHAINHDRNYKIGDPMIEGDKMFKNGDNSVQKSKLSKSFRSKNILLQTAGPPTISIPLRRRSRDKFFSEQTLGIETKTLEMSSSSAIKFKFKAVSSISQTNHLEVFTTNRLQTSSLVSLTRNMIQTPRVGQIDSMISPCKSPTTFSSLSCRCKFDCKASDLASMDEQPDLQAKMDSLASTTKLSKASSVISDQALSISAAHQRTTVYKDQRSPIPKSTPLPPS